MKRAHGRTFESPLGRHASLPAVHSVPARATALRKRSSLVAIEPVAPGWSALGAVDVDGMARSFSDQPTLPCRGVPTTVSRPMLAPLHPKQWLLLYTT